MPHYLTVLLPHHMFFNRPGDDESQARSDHKVTKVVGHISYTDVEKESAPQRQFHQ